MKKFVSLLLAIVLTVSLLGTMSMAADKPKECSEAEAVIKITCEGDSKTYYFPKFTTKEVNWAMAELTTGMRTITLLKDITLSNEDNAIESTYFDIKYALADWGKKNYEKLTFDLGGHTLNYTGTGSLFMMRRFGFTLKNGTINYTGTSDTARAFVTVGGVSGQVAYSNPPMPYQPKLTIENVNVYNNSTGKDPALFKVNTYEFTLNVKNSEMYCQKGGLIFFQMSSQTSIGTATFYEGNIKQVLNAENCNFLTEGGYVFRSASTLKNNATVNLKDTAVLTTGDLKHTTCKADIAEPSATTENYTYTMANGTSVTGKLLTYGDVKEVPGAKVELPFTDVKEGDWFYSFVSDLYAKKIIAGQTATTFNPGGNLTYAAALKLLVVGLTGKDPGNAKSGHWATNYLSEATTAGWTAIGADKLDAPITREAFCEIAAKAKNLTEQPAENKFTDTANPAVLALVKAGVINGMSETTFAPKSVLTRAQISKIICTLRTVAEGKGADHVKNTTPPEHKLPTVAELEKNGEVYYVGKNREHKSFVSLLLDLTGNEKPKTIFIDEGEYDIFAEYRAEVKAGRIAVPADTIGNATYMEAADGKWYNAFVPHNTVIYGLGNVTLRFTPDKDEITYGESRVWSPLNVFGSVEMYNLNVLVKNGRYCLHNDDHNRYANAFQYYYNCRFEYRLGDTNADGKLLGFNSTIGFGINDNSTHFFDNCEMYFVGDGNHGVYYGHDASKGKDPAWIFLKDCHIHASDASNNRVIRLQTLAKNVTDRPIYTTVINCKVNGGLQFNMYYAESIQSFDVTFKNTPEMPVSRTNSKGPVQDNYTVKYEN